MKRHWSHWLMFHYKCHPARCKTAAQMANRAESDLRMQDYISAQDVLRPPAETSHRRWD